VKLNLQVTAPLALAPLAAALLWGQAAQLADNFVNGEHPAINYNTGPLDDPATRLMKKLDSGQLKLEKRKDALGYLPALLKAFDIDPNSQQLVFSKTSFQAVKISPRNPRAIFFNDTVTLGYVRGSDTLEVTSVDPRQGVIFYTFDNSPYTTTPRFDRRDVCMQCHHSPGTLGVPGLMIASVYPDGDGMPAFRGAQALTDHRTPFDERWGGWYVTGTHGEMRHRGNAMGHDRQHPDVLETRGTQNVTDLTRKFEGGSMVQMSSDIVALLTHEHQIRAINYITRTGWEARILAYDEAHNGRNLEGQRQQLDQDINDMADYLMLAEQARFRSKVEGTTPFAKNFTARGPKDTKGRSLRDFNLEDRLFQYPLSYMVYSEAFDALPEYVKARTYAHIKTVLTGGGTAPKYAQFDPTARQAALEILRDTKKGLPAGF
jgi:hypothetical protein